MTAPPEERSVGVGPPPSRLDLPLFAYGVLQRGEVAHAWISEFVESHADDAVQGLLRLRDGLPLLVYGGGRVCGQILEFRSDNREAAWDRIGQFEPRKHYRWVEVATERGIDAWVLFGLSPNKGSVSWEGGELWSASFDPAFNEGLDVVGAMLQADGRDELNFFAPQGMHRFFRLSAAYLLLWSVIERYTALRFGPGLEPMERVRALGKATEFQEGVRNHVGGRQRVVDSRDPRDDQVLDPLQPERAVLYFYQLRSNLSHRGKSAWQDGERLLEGLRELYAIVLDLVPRRKESA